MLSGGMNHASVSGNPQDRSVFSGEQHLSNCTVTSVKFGGGGIMVWGCFLRAGLSHLNPFSIIPTQTGSMQLCFLSDSGTMQSFDVTFSDCLGLLGTQQSRY